MKRIFLDNNEWNLLVSCDCHSDDQRQAARDALKASVTGGSLVVIGSLPVLQEVMATAKRKPGKYKDLRELIFELVSNHWLIPRDLRWVEELNSGGLLPDNLCFISRGNRREMYRLSSNQRELEKFAKVTYGEGVQYKQTYEDARKKIYKDLSGAEGRPKGLKQAYDNWWATVDRELWVRSVIDASIERGKIKPVKVDQVSYDSLPTLWRYVEFSLAKVKLNIGDESAIKEGDGVDADIFASTPYVDTLVTNDGPFLELCELIQPKGLKVIPHQEFMSSVIT